MLKVAGIAAEYYEYTYDTDTKLIFDKVINSVKENLAKYDDGQGHSYYDLLHNPPDKYHLIHVGLLNKLYDITHEEMWMKSKLDHIVRNGENLLLEMLLR